MDKLIPILILVGIIIIGFITKKVELRKITIRYKFTFDYREKFIEYVSEITSKHKFNQQLYYELTSKVKEMQYELGEDGVVAYMTDKLHGYTAQNYQLLINFLPEMRDMLDGVSNYLLAERYNRSIKDCDDMFVRHLGTLNSESDFIRKGLFNPLSSFAEGVKTIILLPLLILNWFGFVSAEKAYKARDNSFIKVLNVFVAILGFIGTVITIVVGWNDFWDIIFKLFK